MEKEKKLGRGRFLSSRCRPQVPGYQRARDRSCLGAGSKQRRTRCKRGAVPTAFSPAAACLCSLSVSAPAVSRWESSTQSGLAFSVRDCRLRMCCSADPRDCHLSKMQQQQQAGRAPARRTLLAPEAPNVLQCKATKTVFQSDRRNNEHDADAVPFLPRFPLQELVFAHCPHQPPIRGNLRNRADWLSLRGIAGVGCNILPIRMFASNTLLYGGEGPSNKLLR